MIVTFTGVAIVLFWGGFQGGISFTDIAILSVLLLILHWVVPSRFDRNFGMFEILFFWIGVPLAMIAEGTLDETPVWLVWTWLGFSLVVSVFFPFSFFKKFSPSSFH